MTDLVHLKNETWSVTLAPSKGASITACECKGVPVLTPAGEDVFQSSCFPMVPYSNRIKDGAFSFAGQDYKIPPNHAGNIFPIHGNGWQQVWQVERVTETECVLTLNYSPLKGGWPWAFHAQQTLTLKGASLTITLSIENTDSELAPAGLGLHPSFANAAKAQAQFKTGAMWACDGRLIPTKRVAITPATDFSIMRAVKGARLDNCFEGWDGHAEILWPNLAGAIRMTASSAFSNMVVYIDPKNDYFCLEPVTHINNALNRGHGMVSLQPNETISGSVMLTYTPSAR